MKVKGLDNKIYVWSLKDKEPLADDLVPRSEPHLRCRKLLKQLFPFDKILEEVPLPGSGGLAADFVILQRKLIVEVHGEQHYNFIPHFHGNRAGFLRAKNNDSIKESWAEINNLRLVSLPHYESDEVWKDILLKLNKYVKPVDTNQI